MISTTFLLILATIFASFYYLLTDKRKWKGKLPPGPNGLPILGSLLSLSITPYIDLGRWVEKYGRILTFTVAKFRFVIISDPRLAREAYNEASLSGRPDLKLFNILAEGNHGVVNSQGPVWSEQRRFTLRTLRDFGFGKETQQNLALEEVRDLLNWFKGNEGKSTLLYNTFDLPTVNSLWTLMTSQRFRQDDPFLTEFIRRSNEVFDKIISNPLAFFFPEFCAKFPKLTGWSARMDAVSQLETYISKPVQNEKKISFNPAEDEPQDFVEAYMKEIAKTKDPRSSFYKSEGEKNQEVCVIDLYNAGSGTTSTTLSFAIMYLCEHPEIQVKLHQEIDRVVGQSRQPTLDDRKRMPYTEAFMYETLRQSSIVPFGLLHQAMETTTVAGYTVPEGTWVGVNLHFIHHDPSIWGDPENFRPERFLSPDGDRVVKNENLMPFSTGKRVCIGEQIAKDTFFLFLTGIMQRFGISFDPNCVRPSLTENNNPLFIVAPPFNVIVQDRTV